MLLVIAQKICTKQINEWDDLSTALTRPGLYFKKVILAAVWRERLELSKIKWQFISLQFRQQSERKYAEQEQKRPLCVFLL